MLSLEISAHHYKCLAQCYLSTYFLAKSKMDGIITVIHIHLISSQFYFTQHRNANENVYNGLKEDMWKIKSPQKPWGRRQHLVLNFIEWKGDL